MRTYLGAVLANREGMFNQRWRWNRRGRRKVENIVPTRSLAVRGLEACPGRSRKISAIRIQRSTIQFQGHHLAKTPLSFEGGACFMKLLSRQRRLERVLQAVTTVENAGSSTPPGNKYPLNTNHTSVHSSQWRHHTINKLFAQGTSSARAVWFPETCPFIHPLPGNRVARVLLSVHIFDMYILSPIAHGISQRRPTTHKKRSEWLILVRKLLAIDGQPFGPWTEKTSRTLPQDHSRTESSLKRSHCRK